MNDSFYVNLPKVELHAHLNGSISPDTMRTLVKLHREKWPLEKMPDNCDLVINGGGGGEYGSTKDPFLIFPIIHAITDNLEAVKIVTRDVIKEFAEDGVKYLELRTTPRDVPDRMTRIEYCQTVLEEIIKITKDIDITVKLLLSIDRKNLAGIDDIVTLYKDLKRNPAYEHILVGLDISGDPRIDNLKTVINKFKRIRQEDGIKITIHLAETVNHDETGAVLDMFPDRLGHGTCIHPSLGGSEKLWSQLQEVKCPVEVCMSSNVVCNTVPSYHKHQADIYHRHGIPIVLCTDDKGVFSCSLSGEMKIAAETFKWSNEELFSLSYNALQYAFVGEKERERLKRFWTGWREENSHYFSF